MSPSTDHWRASPSCLLWGRIRGGVILALLLVLLRVRWLLLHTWQALVYCLGEVGNEQQSERQGGPQERISTGQPVTVLIKPTSITFQHRETIPFLTDFHFSVSWAAKQAKLVAWGRQGSFAKKLQSAHLLLCTKNHHHGSPSLCSQITHH